jgi:cell division protein FtsB
MRPPQQTPRPPCLDSMKGSSFRALVLALFPLALGGCCGLSTEAIEKLSRERGDLLAERQQITAQLQTMENRVTFLEARVQELQDSVFISCLQVLAKDNPLVRTLIEKDCRALCEKTPNTPDSSAGASITEGTFDP